jgi:hypothetical protein
LLADIFVGEEIYYTGVVRTQMQRSSKTVLVVAIFPEQAPGYGPRIPIKRGIREHKAGMAAGTRVRACGGGRPLAEENRPEIAEKILEIVNPTTCGNPQKVLSYTTESLRKTAGKLSEDGIKAICVTGGKIPGDKGYSKQTNQKMLQAGGPNPNRNEQFEYINPAAQEYIDQGGPVISVDTEKKENTGNFRNNGQEYRRKKDPRRILDHEFPLEEPGKTAPYGMYNVNNTIAYVNAGTSHDTGEFAVESISHWRETAGKQTYSSVTGLYIICDCGGSNNYRVKCGTISFNNSPAEQEL